MKEEKKRENAKHRGAIKVMKQVTTQWGSFMHLKKLNVHKRTVHWRGFVHTRKMERHREAVDEYERKRAATRERHEREQFEQGCSLKVAKHWRNFVHTRKVERHREAVDEYERKRAATRERHEREQFEQGCSRKVTRHWRSFVYMRKMERHKAAVAKYDRARAAFVSAVAEHASRMNLYEREVTEFDTAKKKHARHRAKTRKAKAAADCAYGDVVRAWALLSRGRQGLNSSPNQSIARIWYDSPGTYLQTLESNFLRAKAADAEAKRVLFEARRDPQHWLRATQPLLISKRLQNGGSITHFSNSHDGM